MAIFSSKDFTAPNTTRIRTAIAWKLGVPSPATVQQCSDFVTRQLQVFTREYEEGLARAAVSVTDPD